MYTELSVRIDMKFHNGNCCFLYWISLGSQFFIIFFFGIANCHSIQRITECGITCTPAVHCKSRPTYDILFLFCKTAPASLSPHVLDNMKISTVMKCTQTNRCSLYLNVIGTVILNENIRGVKICSMTLSSQRNQCMNVRIARKKQEKSQKVHIQANCFEVGVSEHVYVSMKTIPDYCGVELSEQYRVEDCHNKDVGVNMLSCISGKLDYMVNEGKKTITVLVSNFLEEYDYNVRLCLKHYSCHDIGAHSMIKKDNSTKSVTLPYSVILPCLCIEGWSALPDSRRTRLCPFKNGGNNLNDPVNFILPQSHLCT
ncbi:interleukin-17 receptor E-like protein isoform X2 [Mixophyes fleayi]|uniref:interleukin-17 receptor E-like protein isoform X2 n=1 Tax=Mixophyes fleayi TaxID=3061075 RepID=UPI003F4DC3CF